MKPIGCRAPQKEPLLDTRPLHAEETVRPYIGVFSYMAVTRKVSRKCLSVELCPRSSVSFFRLTRRACWHVVLYFGHSVFANPFPEIHLEGLSSFLTLGQKSIAVTEEHASLPSMQPLRGIAPSIPTADRRKTFSTKLLEWWDSTACSNPLL